MGHPVGRPPLLRSQGLRNALVVKRDYRRGVFGGWAVWGPFACFTSRSVRWPVGCCAPGLSPGRAVPGLLLDVPAHSTPSASACHHRGRRRVLTLAPCRRGGRAEEAGHPVASVARRTPHDARNNTQYSQQTIKPPSGPSWRPAPPQAHRLPAAFRRSGGRSGGWCPTHRTIWPPPARPRRCPPGWSARGPRS